MHRDIVSIKLERRRCVSPAHKTKNQEAPKKEGRKVAHAPSVTVGAFCFSNEIGFCLD